MTVCHASSPPIPIAFAYRQHQRPSSAPSFIQCALTKQGHRFLSTLSVKAGDFSAAHKLTGKFVAGSPKSISLNVLSHLLSPETTHPHLTSHSLLLYSMIKEASWFEFNPKLVAALAALLDKQGRYSESEALISEAVSKLEHRHRELALFYCNLVESHSKQSSTHGFDSSYTQLYQLLRNSSSVYVKRRAFESMVGGLCTMDRPSEGESIMGEMRVDGLKPSVFEFRSVMYGYGRLGLLSDMLRIVHQMEDEGLVIDTICSNMVLSSYGAHNDLPQMVSWLQKMKTSSIPFSIRTYNTALNACPTISAMLQDLKNDNPLSMDELHATLKGNEVLLVKELEGSQVLEEAMVWDSSEVKLDLHGMHLGSAYLIMLQWMEEMQNRFRFNNDGKLVVPAEVVVVCGSGKHSNVRGVSPVKTMIKEMMVRMRSPMKIDRKNAGCFIAKGKSVKDWLC
ncbi:pentatricopeptide repeat-containing protein At2g17033 [Humulus lupulus]|uniref:pentatricopeptide repeat-containing protein At2g17033 n=1 Tax=Humulus lupulus TaxID=3486 RepID=UPI002B40DBB1|nr:pentatricopeptide repeat-containing protein At2g17033 [Humulus lupulus]